MANWNFYMKCISNPNQVVESERTRGGGGGRDLLLYRFESNDFNFFNFFRNLVGDNTYEGNVTKTAALCVEIGITEA